MNLSEYKKLTKPRYAESAEQSTIATYLKRAYPNVIFHTTRVEGKKEFWAQNQIKKQNSHTGFPDTFILEPKGKYAGLMIENKRSGTKLFKKNGQFINDHYRNQYQTHQLLLAKGYAVYFAIGITEAIELIDRYMRGDAMPFLNITLQQTKQDQLADDFFSEYNL